MIAWVDVETTGIDPRAGSLLEVASIVTDDDLVEVERLELLVTPSARDLDRMEPVVREMHERNGLLEDARARGLRRFEAEIALRDFWARLAAGAPIAGSTVGFDRSWLKEHLPAAETILGYRSIDVSSFKEIARRWRPDVLPSKGVPAHRAMSDVLASIAELAHYRAAWLVTGTS